MTQLLAAAIAALALGAARAEEPPVAPQPKPEQSAERPAGSKAAKQGKGQAGATPAPTPKKDDDRAAAKKVGADKKDGAMPCEPVKRCPFD